MTVEMSSNVANSIFLMDNSAYFVATNVEDLAKEIYEALTTNSPAWAIHVNTLQMLYGTAIDEISIDGTLVGDSDDAVPTEKAVKTYVDAAVGAGGHTHDTDTLQLDGINSDGGAFSFLTTGAVTFNQDIISQGDITLNQNLIFAAMQIRSGADYIHVFPTTGNEVGKLCIMPSGNEDEAHLRVRNSVTANWGAVFLAIDGATASISSDKNGTGTAPTTLNINDADWDAINIGDASCAVGLSSVSITGGAVTGVTTLAMNNQLTNTLAIGTPPFVITSTDKVVNLNVDMVDGYHLDQDVLMASSPTFVGLTLTGAIATPTTITTSGNIICGGNLSKPTGQFTISSTDDAVAIRSAATKSQYFDCGANFEWRDMDDAFAVRMTLGSTTGLLSLINELDITGVGACIDLNPAGTGAKDIISITPTAALSGVVAWRGIYIDGAALDPDAAAGIAGIEIDLSGVDVSSGPSIRCLHLKMPAVYGAGYDQVLLAEGDGRQVLLCTDTAAIYTTGIIDVRSTRIQVRNDSGAADIIIRSSDTTDAAIILYEGSTAKFVIYNDQSANKLRMYHYASTDYMHWADAGGIELSTSLLTLTGDLTLSNTLRLDSGIAEPHFIQIDTGTTVWQIIADDSPSFLGFYDGATYLLTLNEGGSVDIPGELDMTGVGACIDLNPAGTGSKNIIDITPSASLVAGSTWMGIKQTLNSLDPATGALCNIWGFYVDAINLTSVDKDAKVYGYYFGPTVTEQCTGFYMLQKEMTENKIQTAFMSWLGGTLSFTAKYRGLHIDWDAVARDANAPALEGIKVELPADYTGFGTSLAGYFSGDGRWVKLCGTTYALDVSGASRIVGDLTVSNLITAGNVDGVDVSDLKADVDGFNDELKDLTQVEIQQLELIDATTISGAQWGYLGALDQSLTQASSPTFVGLTLSGAIATPTNISMTGELDLTGALACIDLNPAGTGSKNIIDITPSAALSGGIQSWKGISIEGTALDPTDASTIMAFYANLVGVDVSNSPNLFGIQILMPVTYGGGTEYGIMVTGDGRAVYLCTDTHALSVSGAMNLAGAISGVTTFSAGSGTFAIAADGYITTYPGMIAGADNYVLTYDHALGTLVLEIAAAGGGESLAATLAIGNETDGTNIIIDSAGDLIVYSDDKVTEKARIDGATGNITTAGTMDGVDLAGLNTAYLAHLHNTHTLQCDGINSNGGAFSFTTTGTVSFNQGTSAPSRNWIGPAFGRLYIDTTDTVAVVSNSETDWTGQCTNATGLSVHRLTYDDLIPSSSISKKTKIKVLDNRKISEMLESIEVKSYELEYALGETKVGLIAEDVPVELQIVDDGKVTGYDLTGMVAMLLGKVNYLEERIEKLESSS